MGLRNGSLVCDICQTTLFKSKNFLLALSARLSSNKSDYYTQGYTYTTQPWKKIDEGENAGCNWCDFLWGNILEYQKCRRDQALRTEEWPNEDETWEITVQFRHSDEPPHHLRLKTYIGKDHFPNGYELHTTEDDPAASIVTGRNIIWQVSSSESFRLSRECIDDCSRNHDCQKASKKLPTRVVDCSDPKNPKLVAGLNREAHYASLSYVWGQAQPHSTSSANIHSYMSKIDIRVLPKTIVDAIVTTHYLGIQYLWTDTLCIIQDSPEDKNKEISQMCDIYQNAYITIIASCAQKAGDGFLHDRKNPISMELPFWTQSGEVGTISVRDLERSPQKEPVNERAWCFQERLLAKRALIYASHTVQFHCQKGLKNVGGGNNYFTVKRRDDLRIPEGRDDQGSLKLDDKAKQNIWRTWKEILAEYTRRSITDPADKLIALSGVAQAFSLCWPVNDSDYIAGLWKYTFIQDLLWHRSSAPARKNRPRDYRAPSWSWAATDGVIADGGWPGRMDPLVMIKDFDISAVPLIPNLPFGEIKGGEIRFDAILRKVSWEQPKAESDMSAFFEKSDGNCKEIGFVYHDCNPCEENEGFALVLAECNKAVLHHLLGLIVIPRGDIPNSFTRVGFFDVHGKIEDEDWDNEPFIDIQDWLSTPTRFVKII